MRYKYITKIEIKFDKKKTFKRKSIKYLQNYIFQESVKLPRRQLGDSGGEGRENFAIFAPMYNLNKIVY